VVVHERQKLILDLLSASEGVVGHVIHPVQVNRRILARDTAYRAVRELSTP
jgi:hypothetical protein